MLYLGKLPGWQLHKLETNWEGNGTQQQGVQLAFEDVSQTRFQIYNRSNDVLWHIKDDARYHEVIDEMQAAGIPIVDTTTAG